MAFDWLNSRKSAFQIEKYDSSKSHWVIAKRNMWLSNIRYKSFIWMIKNNRNSSYSDNQSNLTYLRNIFLWLVEWCLIKICHSTYTRILRTMMRNSLEAYLQIKKSSTVLWDTTWCFHFLWYVLKTFLSSIPNIKVININGISGMHGLKHICVYALPFRKYFLRTYYMCCDVRTLYIYVLRIYITYTIPFLV